MSICANVWIKLIKIVYRMYISYFQLISIRRPKLLMKTTCSLYENNLTLFHLRLQKQLIHNLFNDMCLYNMCLIKLFTRTHYKTH
jgi:hypothetical protein